MTTSESLWQPMNLDDARLREGYDRQRQRLDAALTSGARPAGWKVGMNAPAARQRAGINSSVIGYLLPESFVPADQPVLVTGAKRPGAELELGLHLRVDVDPTDDPATALRAIGEVAPAIEMIDIDAEYSGNLTESLARNVWHRSAIIGPAQTWSPDLLDTLMVCIARGGDAMPAAVSPRASLGDVGELVRFVAGATAALGERLRAGDWILSGMLVPAPVWVAPGDRLRAEYGPLGVLNLTFA